jgi:pentatricopeptide repeat protein
MPQKAIDLFFQISKPNEFIFSIFFKACGQLGNIEGLTLGKRIHSQLPIEYRRSSRVLESILNMFTKFDDQKSAESLFAQLDRNIFCYGSMMKMYNVQREFEKTFVLFKQMKNEKIEPDEIIFTLLIDACSQAGDFDLCRSTIRQIPSKSLIDPWIQNALVDMWVSCLII